MIFEGDAKAWFTGERGLTAGTKAATESRMRTHACPEIGSRKTRTPPQAMRWVVAPDGVGKWRPPW